MATRSSILAWRIPWTEEPSGLQAMGLQRVGLEANIFTFFSFQSTFQNKIEQDRFLFHLGFRVDALYLHLNFKINLLIPKEKASWNFD